MHAAGPTSRFSQRIIFWGLGAFWLWLCWSVGQLVWVVWLPASTIEVTMGPQTREPQAIADVASLSLFGRPAAVTAAVSNDAARSAPPTALQLVLLGVVVDSRGEDSGAIIGRPRGEANYYRIGEEITDNASLAGVYADRVVISRSGVFETLRFLDDPGSMLSEVAEPIPAASPTDWLQEAQRQLAGNPDAALRSAGLRSLAGDSGPAGYEYLGNNPILEQAGLQLGDVIKSVNGEPIGDIERDRARMDTLVQAGNIQIEIERSGAVLIINYALPR